MGVAAVSVSVTSAIVAGVPLRMDCIVAARLVEAVDMIFGIDIINEFGGMSVHNCCVGFCCERRKVQKHTLVLIARFPTVKRSTGHVFLMLVA